MKRTRKLQTFEFLERIAREACCLALSDDQSTIIAKDSTFVGVVKKARAAGFNNPIVAFSFGTRAFDNDQEIANFQKLFESTETCPVNPVQN